VEQTLCQQAGRRSYVYYGKRDESFQPLARVYVGGATGFFAAANGGDVMAFYEVAPVRQTLRRMFSAMVAERAKKRRKLVLTPDCAS
jgi:hypothetical protein